MRPEHGRRAAVERMAGVAAMLLAAATFACRDTATAPEALPASLSAITRLHLPTPDGTFNLLHPSVHCNDSTCVMLACQHTVRDGFGGGRSNIVENTVGFRSAGTDMLKWMPLDNPIMSADEIDSTTDFSDPELLDLRPALVAYARLVPEGFDVLYMKETSDTVTWTPLREVLRAGRNALVSPTVLQNGSVYDLWVVEAGPLGCNSNRTSVVRRRSGTYADFTYSAFDVTNLNERSVPGMVPWHIEMVRGPTDRPDSIIALVAMHPAGSVCGDSRLYMGTTRDGLHFRMGRAPMRTGAEDGMFSMVYRSSGVYFPKDRTFVAMLSGTKSGGWPEARLARITYDYDSLLAATRRGQEPEPLSVQMLPASFSAGEGR